MYSKRSLFFMLKKISLLIFILIILCVPFASRAQEMIQDQTTTMEAVVVSVDSSEKGIIEFTGLPEEIQTITARITSGEQTGKIVQIRNDYLMLKAGDKFFAHHIVHGNDGTERYTVAEPNRLGGLLFFTILFIAVLFIFGGIQGIRGLASLAGSLALIVYFLLPGILQGHSPILVSLGIASIIIVLGSFVTHGFNRTTLSAVLGMIATIAITGALAVLAVHMTSLTGYESEESVYLNFNTGGSINMAGLLLGGILIGLLGVLYDAAIGQAVSVEELLLANPHMHKKTLYQRVTRIGREHIGALVNTLAIAYVGVSLPLLLLFYSGAAEPIKYTLNREIFSTEIIRILIGSIGLVLAIPITSIVSIFVLTRAKHLQKTHEGHGHHH